MYTFEELEVIAVTARNLCPRPLWEQVPRIRQAGISRLILREKDLTLDAYTALAEKILRSCEDCGMTLVIHNYPEAARKLGVNDLHMPLPLLTADLCREFDTAGTSVHSKEQLRQSELLGADYVTAGHIFATDCKKGVPPRGTAFLSDICRLTALPVYAIGGISAQNLPQIAESGAAGACIMSGAMRL